MLKFISWNVNGLRACYTKGFAEAFKQLDADFFCLQETKMQAGQFDLSFEGYHSYWNYAEKKGYSGTAIFTRKEPLSVTYGIGIEEHDHEGRVITLEMDTFYLVTVYTPNSQDGLRRLEYRMVWEADFRQYLKKLEASKPVIVCGDLNVAHREIDLKNPKTNRMNAGFTDEERAQFTTLLESGFHRHVPPFLSRFGRSLLMVVVPLQSTREERRMAHRLFSGFQCASASTERSGYSLRDIRIRPLPGGIDPGSGRR